jgi:Tol biopolymer transport system component
VGTAAKVPSSTIVFTSNATETANYEIFTANNDGTSVHRMTFDAAYNSIWPRISPDRTLILFYRTPVAAAINDYTQMSLWVMNADGSNARQLLAEHAYGWSGQGHAEWSPDGRHLVMFGGTTIAQIFVTAADGSAPRLLVARPQPSIDPNWSPDGRDIVFVSCPTSPCPVAAQEIFTIPSAGGATTQRTNDALRDNDPSYSPDGSRIVFETELQTPTSPAPAGVWALRTISAIAGSSPNVLLSDGNVNTNPLWSSDGGTVYFYRFVYGAAKWQIYSISSNATNLRQLSHSTTANSEMVAP